MSAKKSHGRTYRPWQTREEPMSSKKLPTNVTPINAERWVNRVFETDDLRVDVSTLGRVRFTTFGGYMGADEHEAVAVLTMQQVFDLGTVLSAAFHSDNSKELSDG